jgi:CheY-like chemotaxis protein
MYQLAIVDDNEAWCFVIANLLSQHGYDVSTFTDVSRFMQEASRFDLALIDFSIPPKRYQPDLNGSEVIRRLKQQLEKPPLFVLVSAFFIEDILKQASELFPQADAYLSKGVESKELVQQIEKLLVTRRPSMQDTVQGSELYHY